MLAELFASVADAVISYAIEKLDPAEALKTWLKRDPAKLAFQKALARVYAAFARQYPDYTGALFDQSFLTKEAVPELSKILIRNQHPDPALLARTWCSSIGASSEFSVRATKPASDFLHWLEAELKAEQAFQALFDARALDSLPHIEAEIEKLTAELQRGLDAALKAAKEYQRVTLHIEGDVTDSNIIVGDNNQLTVNKYYYSGDFVSLNEYYIPPASVFQRVGVDEFVGREWLIAKVDAFLNDLNRKSGAFLLIGDAGVGKTSFMAHLVRERQYLHLFAEQVPGQAMLQRALQSLGSQLVTRYQIDPYRDRDTLTQLAGFPDFLERLLRLAASNLTNGEKIVIVCDALDEAGTFPDGNVFGIPNVLPDGVYLILSQRPVNTKLPNFEPVIENLEAHGEDNLQDIGAYLRAAAKRSEVVHQIRAREYSEEFFIQTLKEKSQGVWMYLYYVIKEIESGSRAPLDLGNLPRGLVGYYAEYWEAWRTGKRGKGEETWDALYAPLLTTLAAAQEAITVEQLIQWTDVTAKSREVTRLLCESWRAFITEREGGESNVYALYHLSFKDFISGRVDINKLPPAHANLVKDLAAQTVDAHKRIVDAFKAECNGEWEKLVEQNYPRLHLTAHLAGAKQYEKLTDLLMEGEEHIQWAKARERKEETYAGYLNDLTHIWDHAERTQNYALAMRCLLIENSIHSLASAISPELLNDLVDAELWSLTKCLSIIQQQSSPDSMEASLEIMAPKLPPALQKEALVIACEIKEIYPRARALAALAPYIPNELIDTMFTIACDIQDEVARGTVFLALAPRLSEGHKAKALPMALDVEDKEARVRMLVSVASCISDTLKAEMLADIRKTSNEYSISGLLSALVPYLPDDLKAEALADACNILEDAARASAVAHLAPYLTTELKAHALDVLFETCDELSCATELFDLVPHLPEKLRERALSNSRKMQNKYAYACALSALAPSLSGESKIHALSDAMTAVGELEDEFQRVYVLSALAPHLSGELRDSALLMAREVRDDRDRSRLLTTFGIFETDNNQTQIILGALAAANTIRDVSQRAAALSALMPHLPEALRAEAFDLVYGLESGYFRAIFLSRLAPHLPDALKQQAFLEAVSSARLVPDKGLSADALLFVAGQLPDNLKNQVFDEILVNALETGDYSQRSLTLSRLLPYLPADSRAHVFDLLFEIPVDYFTAATLCNLVPYLPDNLRLKTFDNVRNMRHEYARARAFAALTPYLSDDLKSQALAEIAEIKSEYDRASTLAAVASCLPDELKGQALISACGIQNEDFRALVLAALSPHLPEALIPQALTAARELKSRENHARVQLALACHQSDEFQAQALDGAHKIRNQNDRANALLTLLPHLSDSLRSQALAVARQIEIDEIRARTLSAFAPSFDKETYKNIMQEVLFYPYLAKESWGNQGDEFSLRDLTKQWKKIDFDGLGKSIIPFFRIAAPTSRMKGLALVENLAEPLTCLSGKEIALKLYRAITDVTRWWP